VQYANEGSAKVGEMASNSNSNSNSNSCSSPPTPPLLVAPLALVQARRHPPPQSLQEAPPLLPEPLSFSPSATHRSTTSEELPEWLRFSPSSSKERSSGYGRVLGPSLGASFIDVVRNKGKVPTEASSSRSSRGFTPPSSRGAHGRH
jgi:hypothetical protein